MKKIENTKDVLPTYRITDKTYALIPTRTVHHQSKVIEKDKVYYVNQSPLEIINLNYLLNGSDYRGRRQAISYHLNFTRKTPIAINKTLHAFPTHSIKDFDCIWIISKQIAYIKPQS